MKLNRRYALAVMGPVAILLAIVFLAPLAYFLRYAFYEGMDSDSAGFTADNLLGVISDGYEVAIIRDSLIIAVIATAASLVLSLPLALLMRASSPRLKSLLIILCIFPLLTGSVVRTIGWQAIFGYSGLLNSALLGIGVIEEPLELFRSVPMVTLVIISIVLSFMVLLIHAGLEQVDRNTELAAQALGAGPISTFFQVTLPQTVPSLIAGTTLVFVLSVNAYATPVLIGAGEVKMAAPRIFDLVAGQGNLTNGAAFAIVLVTLTFISIGIYGWLMRKQFLRWAMVGRG